MASPAANAAPPPGESGQGWAKGRILVMPRAGLPEKALARILAGHRGKAKRMGGSNLFVVELPANASEKAVAALLAHNPHIEFAELDYKDPPSLTPNDPYLGSEWHLSKIGAPAAWDDAQGAGVTIAVLDSGVDSAHPDLAAKLVPGWNFYDNNANTSDVYGHGTKVAGSAAAASNNGIGVAAVAGHANIMPIRVTDLSGAGYSSMIANGLIYAADNGVRVANISFANQPSRSAVVSASQYMKDKGGLVFVAAGNYGTDAGFTPTTSMIPVSATSSSDIKASWSSYGDYVTLSAPGVSIYSTVNGGGYGAVSGTSFSSPVAAGVAALVMSAKPTLSSNQVESTLFATALDLGASGRDPYYGYGRVDAAAAVQAALNTPGPVADTTPPSAAVTNPASSATVSGLVSVDVSASDNVGVVRVELWANDTKVASDTTSPYGFSWDSTTVENGAASLVAYAFDAAGNSKASAAVSVNVVNNVVADTTPPVVTVMTPGDDASVTGTVSITIGASDNNGAAGITQSLYVDGALKATASGGSLLYNWNTRKVSVGTHAIQAVARDAAGNSATSTIQVTKSKTTKKGRGKR